MHLSTSSSERRPPARRYARPIAGTLTMLVLLLAAVEGLTRFGYTRISHIESRTYREYHAALDTRPGGPTRPAILLLGNSLLDAGVDVDGLRRELGPRATPVRFLVEQTAYLDWYYGIRRLLSEGARPDRIVLCLNMTQLLASSLRGDYTAYYLIRTPDLASAGRDAGMNLTGISNLFFARYSLFLAGKSNLRSFVLNLADPSYARALHDFVSTAAPPLTDAQVLAVAGPRLKSLRMLCSEYHVRFDLLLPPGFERGSESLLEAAKIADTHVLIPVPQGSWDQSSFGDGFHLTPEAAQRFTGLLASALLAEP